MPKSLTSRAWAIIAALNVLLIATLLVYSIGTFPEFAVADRLSLGVSLVAAVGFTAFAVLVLRPRRRWLGENSHTAFTLGAVGFLLALGLLPVAPFPAPHLAHVHSLLTFVVTLFILYVALFDTGLPLRHGGRWIALAGGIVLAVMLIRFYGLAVAPFLDLQDEPWVTAWTVSFMKTGHFGDPTLGGMGDAYYAYPRFYWLMGAWMQVFGVGLVAGRQLTFFLILPVIGFTALAARNFYGGRAGVLTAGVLIASAVLFSAARIRHDIGLAICLSASLWLHSEAVKRRSDALHALAGVIMGLGMFSHYHASGLGVAMFIGLYVPAYIARRKFIPPRSLILYGVGGLVGALIVLFVQIIPDNLPAWLSTLTQQAKYSIDVTEFGVAFVGSFFNIGFFSIFELLLLLLGVGAAWRRRAGRDIGLILILVLGHLALAIMAAGAIYYYIVPLAPIYALLIGSLFVAKPTPDGTPAALGALPLRRGEVVLFAILLMPLLGATTTRGLQAMLTGEATQPSAPTAVQWVLDNVRQDSRVMGDLYYYFWLKDYDFVSHLIPDFMYPENEARLTTLEAIWGEVDFDYLIVDPHYERSYHKYIEPLLATGWVDAHYTIAAELGTGADRTVIYQRR